MANYDTVADLLAADVTNMTIVRSSANDDGTDTIEGVDWFEFKGVTANYIYVSGNSWFGLGTNAEQLLINRIDSKCYKLYREEGIAVSNRRFLKIRWDGYSRYNQTSSSYRLVYDVILWDNGDISIHMITIPSSNYGTYTLNAASSYSYSVNSSQKDVTFYHSNGAYTVAYEVTTIGPSYDMKYLVRSGSEIYTIIDGALSLLDAAEVSSTLFAENGVDEKPDGALLVGLTDPEVLYWHDSTDELPVFTINVTGVPPAPQVLVSNVQDMSHETVLGISSATATVSDDVLIAISFDGGVTWKAYDGTQWNILESETDGMTAAVMNAVTAEAWTEIVTSTSYKLRFVLFDITSYVTTVVIDYTN